MDPNVPAESYAPAPAPGSARLFEGVALALEPGGRDGDGSAALAGDGADAGRVLARALERVQRGLLLVRAHHDAEADAHVERGVHGGRVDLAGAGAQPEDLRRVRQRVELVRNVGGEPGDVKQAAAGYMRHAVRRDARRPQGL